MTRPCTNACVGLNVSIFYLFVGDYTLVIEPVTLEDDAVFQCQVGPGNDGSRELRSPNAKLTVEVPTQPPRIIQGDILATTEDNEIEIECRSNGGKPAAEVGCCCCSSCLVCYIVL